MKKLSLLAAAAVVLAWAGNAQAQTSAQTLTATANIEAVVTLDVVDALFECGTVAAGDTACGNTTETAEFTVIANSDWTLTLVDQAAGNTANQVTLAGGNNADDSFVLALTLSAVAGTSTGGDQILVTETGANGITLLDNNDDHGAYSGTAVLTLTGT